MRNERVELRAHSRLRHPALIASRRVDARDGSAARLVRDRAFIQGAESLLSDYVRLAAGQSAIFVYDAEVKAVSSALNSIAADAGIIGSCVSAELDWTAIEKQLALRCDAVVFLEGGKSHHTRALLHYLSTSPTPPRAYRVFGGTAHTIRHGFLRRQDVLRRRNWDLIAHARRGRRLIVESSRGTYLRVGLDPTAPWTNTYGESADGYPGVLPPAEVNTRSAEVDGVLVVDGAIASNIGWPLDARLGADPVTLRISQGRIIDVDCRRRLVRHLIEEFLCVPECNEVVEMGIGTNDGIREFVASDILLNERFATFHLGVGSADAAIPEQNLHLDFILANCRILMGSHVALSNSSFTPPTTVVPDRRSYEVKVSLHDAL